MFIFLMYGAQNQPSYYPNRMTNLRDANFDTPLVQHEAGLLASEVLSFCGGFSELLEALNFGVPHLGVHTLFEGGYGGFREVWFHVSLEQVNAVERVNGDLICEIKNI